MGVGDSVGDSFFEKTGSEQMGYVVNLCYMLDIWLCSRGDISNTSGFLNNKMFIYKADNQNISLYLNKIRTFLIGF